MIEADKLLRVSSVSKRFDCSISYVYRLIDLGELKAVKIGVKKGLRVFESEVSRFLKDNSEKP